jgi:23S rRNA (adenine2503-C2)-methyltransferase
MASEISTPGDTRLPDLADRLPDEIEALLKPLGLQPYRSLQVFQWIHQKSADSFDQMTNLPQNLRAWLASNASLSRLETTDVLVSVDGSRKLLFDAGEGRRYSAVLMPTDERVTLCISSQAGCRMACRFCMTGSMGFFRNLTAAEIVGQVHAASRLLPAGSRVSNVVFMGMGEPLDNLDAVMRAARIITHREGLRVAPRRTTISTVGLLERLSEVVSSGMGLSIALSVCATKDDIRAELVPASRRHGNIAALVDRLAELTLPHGHVYTIEYTLIKGVGDSIEDAMRLSRMLARFPHKVNLIPFNPWPGTPYCRPSDAVIQAFRQVLEDKHHRVTVRISRGQDIGAACGQLDFARDQPNSGTHDISI